MEGYIFRCINKLKGNKITNIHRTRNFIANFVRILGICKEFAGNRVNELGNIPRSGVVQKFTYLEVMALSITPLNKAIQVNLFETANISLEVPYRLNQKNF